ncbi:YraN family protein [Roseburia hominis]
MAGNRRAAGTHYEQLAGEFLEKQGYRILAYNYRCRYAEIDIVAMEGETLVFCEVKYRKGDESGHALEAVDSKKQRRLWYAALNYLSAKQLTDIPCRFDVLGITGTTFTLVKDAFQYTGGS